MGKKLVDIVAPIKSKPKFVWSKQTKDSINPVLLPFALAIVGSLVVFNLISVGLNLNKNTEIILDSAKSGIASLNIAKDKVQTADFEEAISYFKNAQAEFQKIVSMTQFLDTSIQTPTVLANSIKELSVIGQELALVGQVFKTMPTTILELNKQALLNPNSDIPGYTQEIAENAQKISDSLVKLDKIISNLNSLNLEFLPKKYSQEFTKNLDLLKSLNNKLVEANNYLDSALILLGHQVPHQLLIMVQNNNELRGTGGFPGALMFVEISKGIVGEINVVDVYDLDGGLVTSQEVVPPEFKGFTKEILIRDSNYTPEFSVSARRLENLVQKANGPSSDTIIAVDQHLIQEILNLTGPVALPNYQAKISAENFNVVLNYLIEDSQNKTILQGFISEFKKKLSEINDFVLLANLLYKNLTERHIQIYSKVDTLQATIESLGLTTNLNQLPKTHDLLLVTNTSIGGNKSDKYIVQKVAHDSKIKNKNTILNYVKIDRKHTFKDSEEQKWINQLAEFGITKLKDEIRYVLGRGDNITMVKVYVPLGAKLISSKGIQESKVSTHKDPDMNLTYFMYQSKLSPGESDSVELNYVIRRDLGKGPAYTYKLKVLPQAGTNSLEFQKTYSTLNSFFSLNNFKPYQFLPAGSNNSKMDITTQTELGVIFGL